jgi:hypothetical protein
MATPTGAAQRDSRWQAVLENVPLDFLANLAKAHRGHKLENLTKGHESLVNEIFRLYDGAQIDLLLEQFPGVDGPIWFYRSEEKLTPEVARSRLNTILSTPVTKSRLLDRTPSLFNVDVRGNGFFFRYAARDRVQNLSVGLNERERIETVNYYTALLHFSDPKLIVVGPYTSERAKAVSAQWQSDVLLGIEWVCLKPNRGEGKDFYHKLKASLKADLIDTRRHDPAGDYETVAMESRPGKPDLETVGNFKKAYFDAEFVYNVLRFSVPNPIGIIEQTHVKFGRPFGRFSFKSRTSVAAFKHFEKVLNDVIS